MITSNTSLAGNATTEGAGSVLVVGAGIAGIQAALDCANSGFKVYLLEEQPAIGGNMARLDKTFPTNDCAMCMISPKLVEVGRHHNVEIISYADLKNIEGEPGNFSIEIEKRARFVSEEKCNGCADCEEACPVNVASSFDGELANRKAIYRLYPQAIPNVFAISKAGVSPCRTGCPCGVNAHGYVALTAQGKYADALRLIRETNPFTGSCGMVCAHPCEDECQRGKIDDPVAICSLKRFVFESATEDDVEATPITHSEKVAVLGGGPAGLSCAYHIRRMGYETTVFEASSCAGGMLRMAIPDFRLPREVVDRDVEWISRNGVDIKLNAPVGADLPFAKLRDEHAAVFIATGAPKARKLSFLNLPDEHVHGVFYGIDFLKSVKMGEEVKVGRNAVVIGGGHTALDVAETALGSGAEEVTIIELLPEEKMPPLAEEVVLEHGEQISSLYSTSIEKVEISDGRVAAVHCHKVRFEEPDESGELKPISIDGSQFTLPADAVLFAIGQYSDLTFLPEDIEQTKNGTIIIDPETLTTSVPGVFAGGDVAAGPDVVIKAIACGRRAAMSIDRYLRGEELGPIQLGPEGAKAEPDVKKVAKKRRLPLFRAFSDEDRQKLEEIAKAEAERCLNCGICSECQECVRACKPEAVEHDMKNAARKLNVGAIVLTNGYDSFDATRKSEYGFGRYPNVVSSMQFERILSASGPYKGHLRRPSDGQVPKKIAWIQCVGSRDVTVGNDYCSSVCCMYATKEAIMAKEHERIVEPTIFFTDLRAFGKGFEGFYNRAKEHGVRFARRQISSVKEDAASGNLVVRYPSLEGSGGTIAEEEFDMVVLSTGLVAGHSMMDLAKTAGVECNRFGFASRDPFELARTTRDGVYASGAALGPKDIPDTVMQSSAAAALCGELLSGMRGTDVAMKNLPPEKDIAGADPRIGVFICHCGTNIASVVDVEAVSEYAKTLGGVVHSQNTLYTCSQDTQELIKQLIIEKDLNRIIIASCTPRTHEPLFKQTLREAGLNEYMFEMVNIREQCSWVHREQKQAATAKAKSLISGAVAKAYLLTPLRLTKVSVTQAAIVVGGGIAGITVSLSLARQGFKVHLVERDDKLGGNLPHVRRSLEGHDWQEYLDRSIAEVRANPNIDTHLNSTPGEVSGFVGNFRTTLNGSTNHIDHGVMVVATGADEWRPDRFMYGEDKRVLTQWELQDRIEAGFTAESVVMIQCVGSRCEEREYCSRICCGEAVKNSLAIKDQMPDTDVYVLYRDIRTYEFREEYYRKAREKGVRFIHFPDDEYPEVTKDGAGLTVTVHDDLLDEKISLSADLVALSAATAPHAENEHLAQLLKVPLDSDGFFMEAHVKLRPVEFANAGIFVCGLAHSPKYTEENITQALAVAGRAACILSQDSLEVGGAIATVDPDKCASCLTCVRECVYDAPFINAEGKAEIEAAKCQGCGNCVAACPAKAIQLGTFTDEQESALFKTILQSDARAEMELVADEVM